MDKRFFEDNMKVLLLIAGLAVVTIGGAIFVLQKSESVETMYVTANTLAEKKDRAAAIEKYTEVIASDPSHFDAWYNRGVMRSQLGDKPAALADYTEALKIKPDLLSARVNRGALYRRMGNFTASLEDLNVAVEIAPNHKLARYQRGMTQVELGAYDDAAQEFERALKIDKNFTDAAAEREHAKAMSAFKRRDQAALDASLVGLQRIAENSTKPALKKAASQPWLWIMSHIPNEVLCNDMTISENKACPGKMRVGPAGYIQELVSSFSQSEGSEAGVETTAPEKTQTPPTPPSVTP
jgi:tetratricopeptide (TPR) repeat protein